MGLNRPPAAQGNALPKVSHHNDLLAVHSMNQSHNFAPSTGIGNNSHIYAKHYWRFGAIVAGLPQRT